MKKQVARLSLTRETIRVLKNVVLVEVVGGIEDDVSVKLDHTCVAASAAQNVARP